jgi:hypothetical protein
MPMDSQIQLGILLAIAAGLGVIVLLLGAAMEWLLGPVQPVPPIDGELPSFVRPVTTHRCVWCHESRLDADLLRLDGIGLVCREGCDEWRVA